jgi:hypothetical protein
MIVVVVCYLWSYLHGEKNEKRKEKENILNANNPHDHPLPINP